MTDAPQNPATPASPKCLQSRLSVGISKAFSDHAAEHKSNPSSAAKGRIAVIQAAIRPIPRGGIVYVPKADATLFRSPPDDGHIYVVEDPLRKNVCHWTFPGGKYECWDTLGPLNGPPDPLLKHLKKKTRGKNSKKAKQTRLAENFAKGKNIKSQSDEPPEICLIDLHRVIRIVGFGKSFIYEREDFPKPVQLGASQRSAVRWLESEVVAWVGNLTAQREHQVD